MMSEKFSEDELKERQEIISTAYQIAASLQKTKDPQQSLQILSMALGMILCACINNRETISSVLKTFVDQVNIWCDYEENDANASWSRDE